MTLTTTRTDSTTNIVVICQSRPCTSREHRKRIHKLGRAHCLDANTLARRSG